MFEFEKKKKKKGKKRRNTGRFAPHEDANESGEGEGEVRPPLPLLSCERKFFDGPSRSPPRSLLYARSPEPRTFNLRGNLAHVDLLAAVPCALQGYRALVRE